MNKHADFSKEEIVIVCRNQLDEFIRQSKENTDNQKYRFCLHDSPDNILQEMFIVRAKGEYFRPDKHVGIPETHILLKGEEAVILFKDNGEIDDIIILNDDILAYRINKSIYHTMIALSDVAVDYEVRPGPFMPEMSKHPEWAPVYEEKDKIKVFMDKIVDEVNRKKMENEII